MIAMMLLVLTAADPETPVEIAKDDVPAFLNPKHKRHEEVMRKYDGKLIKVTGQAEYNAPIYSLAIRNTIPKAGGGRIDLIPIDHASGKAYIERNKGKTITIYGRAKLSKEVNRLAKDYEIPANLRPKSRAGSSESIQDTFDRIQGAMLSGEDEKLVAAIVADARKKGKLERVTIWGPFALEGVTSDRRRIPKD